MLDGGAVQAEQVRAQYDVAVAEAAHGALARDAAALVVELEIRAGEARLHELDCRREALLA